MKILFLTHYYTPEGNAPATRVNALAERWVKDGHDVTVVTCVPNVPNGVVYEGYQNRWTCREVINGVKVIRVWSYIAQNKGTVRRVINYISYMISAFLHCLFMPKPDIMIATSPQFFCGWAGVLLHCFRRFPFILEIRDIWPESIKAVNAGLPEWILRFIGRMELIMYRTAMHIVTVGDGYKQKLVQERGVPEEKISIIMNGVDSELFFPHAKNESLLNQYGLGGKFVCSYIGTVGMACGLYVVLDAADKLKQEFGDRIAFALIGDGAFREDIQMKAESRGLDNIIFTGRRPRSEMPDWIASSDVSLVHLKKTDLFTTVMPSKIFESAGCARPIIIGVDGFAKKFVLDAEAGLPMEPENADDLVEILKKMFADPDLCARLGSNAYQRIALKNNRNQQAKEYLKILEKNIA